MEVELTRATDPGYALTNAFTNATPYLPRARAWRFHLVFLYDGSLDQNVGNITNVTLEVKTHGSPSTAPLISTSITGAAINTALTDAQRVSRASQHAIVDVAAGSTGLNMGSPDVTEKQFDLVITATRNGSLVTLASGSFMVANDGGQYSGNTPTAGDPTYYTKDQIDGMLASYLKILNEPGVKLILVSEDGTRQRLLGVDNDGNRTDDVQ